MLNRLVYSRLDERGDVTPRHDIPTDGDLVNGTVELRNAANLYRLFCHVLRREGAFCPWAATETTRRATGACFASNLVRRRLSEIASPG